MSRPRVLVVDDKENILHLFEKILADIADVTTTMDPQRALALVEHDNFDVVVTDIRMPDIDGLTLLKIVKRAHPDIEVVLMTAYGSVAAAVQAMKDGAYDYLTKPFEPDEAALVVQRASERKQLREQARSLKTALDGVIGCERLVGKSVVMQRVFQLINRAAASESTVLVSGESGTGKELVARAVHAASARRTGPFVPVNCGALPENLIESELFGYKKGAFTGAASDRRGLFEEAGGGVLFLDEVAELPLPLQVKLTRVLQEKAVRPVGGTEERPVDVRIVAATNIELRAAVANGRLREDLYYRLNIFPIRLPPLRERQDDIALLAEVFLTRHGGEPNRPHGFTAEALKHLLRYAWPGNVRELENAIARAVAVCDGERVDVPDLPDEVVGGATGPTNGSALTALSYSDAVEIARERASRDYLAALLRDCDGNVTRAAERAGVQRESMHRLLKRYGLHSDDFKI